MERGLDICLIWILSPFADFVNHGQTTVIFWRFGNGIQIVLHKFGQQKNRIKHGQYIMILYHETSAAKLLPLLKLKIYVQILAVSSSSSSCTPQKKPSTKQRLVKQTIYTQQN